MEMEKKNLLGLLLILLILFLYPFYLSRFSPSPPAPKIVKTKEIPSPEITTIQSIDTQKLNACDTVHDTVIKNKYLEIKCSNQGGGISSIRLIRFNNQKGEDFLTIYKNDGYSKNLFFLTEPLLNYELNKVLYAYREKEKEIEYRLMVPQLFVIEKKFTLEDNHSLKFTLRIKNLDEKPLPLSFGFLGAQNLKTKEPWEERYWEIAYPQEGKIKHEFFRQIRTSKIYLAPLAWLALKSKYFSQIVVPSVHNISFTAQRSPEQHLEVLAQIPLTLLQAGETKEEDFLFYFVPLDTRVLNQYNSAWKGIVYYGMFDGIAKFILTILKGIFSLFKNYGLAIIFLSFLVNFPLFLFTRKSMHSIRALQNLQPRIEELRKEYAQDPQRLNKEILELYREHRVNPFSGCLPLFLQMPIFISLYQVLSRAIELKGARFLWIKDLSLPDALITFPRKILFLNSLNLLPLIMVWAMYLQQRKTQVYSPSQKQSTWFMPLFLGFIFYNFPSGLVLYWLVSTFLNLGMQSKIQKK